MTGGLVRYLSRQIYREGQPTSHLISAVRRAGVEPWQLVALNVVDQEASLEMAYLTLKLVDLIRKGRPGVVQTHAYEGGHPDHDAAARPAITPGRNRRPASASDTDFSGPSMGQMHCVHAWDGLAPLSPSSCPGLTRASTSYFFAAPKTWMAGTSPAMTDGSRAD